VNVLQKAQRGAAGEAISVNIAIVAGLSGQRDMGRTCCFQRGGDLIGVGFIILITRRKSRRFWRWIF
jgi:hypothetical protein